MYTLLLAKGALSLGYFPSLLRIFDENEGWNVIQTLNVRLSGKFENWRLKLPKINIAQYLKMSKLIFLYFIICDFYDVPCLTGTCFIYFFYFAKIINVQPIRALKTKTFASRDSLQVLIRSLLRVSKLFHIFSSLTDFFKWSFKSQAWAKKPTSAIFWQVSSNICSLSGRRCFFNEFNCLANGNWYSRNELCASKWL